MNSTAVSNSNYLYIESMHLCFTYIEGHFTYLSTLPFLQQHSHLQFYRYVRNISVRTILFYKKLVS